MARAVHLIFTLGLFFWASAMLHAEGEATGECPRTITITDTAELFVSIRHFEGVNPADIAEISRIARDEFSPLLKEAPGFRLYATADVLEEGNDTGGTTTIATAINVFTSEEEMRDANELAQEFVSENAAELLPEAPDILSGKVQALVYANHCPTSEMSAGATEDETAPTREETDREAIAFLGYHVYRGFDESSDFDSINELLREGFAPVISSAEGFILYLAVSTDDSRQVTLNIFTSEEELTEANERAAQFTAAELAELIPNPPASYVGDVNVLDLSGLFPADGMEGDMSEEADGG